MMGGLAAEEVWYDAKGKVVRIYDKSGSQMPVGNEKPEWLKREAPQGEPIRWENRRLSRRSDGTYVTPAWYDGYRYPRVVYGYRDASYWESDGCDYRNHGRLRFHGKGWSVELRR